MCPTISSYLTIVAISGHVGLLYLPFCDAAEEDCGNEEVIQECNEEVYQREFPCGSMTGYSDYSQTRRCVRPVAENVTWWELEQRCAALCGGTIVKLNKRNVDKHFTRTMRADPYQDIMKDGMWIMLYKSDHGVWAWGNEDPIQLTYTNWEQEPPTIDGQSRCGYKMADVTGKWQSDFCYSKHPGLCEIPSERLKLYAHFRKKIYAFIGRIDQMNCTGYNFEGQASFYYRLTGTYSHPAPAENVTIGDPRIRTTVTYEMVDGHCRKKTVLTLRLQVNNHDLEKKRVACCVAQADPDSIDAGEICTKFFNFTVAYPTLKPILVMNADEPPAIFYVGAVLQVQCNAVLGDETVMTWAVRDNTGHAYVWYILRNQTHTVPDIPGLKVKGEGAIEFDNMTGYHLTTAISLSPVTTQHNNWTFSCFSSRLKPERLERSLNIWWGITSERLQIRHGPEPPLLLVHYHKPPNCVYNEEILKAYCIVHMSTADLLFYTVILASGEEKDWKLNITDGTVEAPSTAVPIDISFEKEYVDVFTGFNVNATLTTIVSRYLEGAVIQCFPYHINRRYDTESEPLILIYLPKPPTLEAHNKTRSTVYGSTSIQAIIKCDAHVGTDGVLTWALFYGPSHTKTVYWRIDTNNDLEHTFGRFTTLVRIQAQLRKTTEYGPFISSDLNTFVESEMFGAVFMCCSFNLTKKMGDKITLAEYHEPNCQTHPLPSSALEGSTLSFLPLLTFVLIGVLLMTCCIMFAKRSKGLESKENTVGGSSSMDPEDNTVRRGSSTGTHRGKVKGETSSGSTHAASTSASPIAGDNITTLETAV